MKKVLCYLLSICLVFGSFTICFAESLDSSRLWTDTFLVEDMTTGEVLSENNADEPMYIASLTKMMTALVAMDYIRQNNLNIDTETIVTDDDCMGLWDTAFGLKSNEEFTFADAINIMLVKSVNGIAVAVAKGVAGTEESFASLMNAKAKDLGCTNTVFQNATGLELVSTENYSTARDLAIIAKALMKDEYLAAVVGQESYNYSATNRRSAGTVQSSNMLYYSDQYIYAGNEKRQIKYENANIIGVKTGTEEKAGNCLVVAAEKDGTKILAVILKSGQSTFERFADAHMLLDWAFANFKTVKLAEKDDELGIVKVKKGEFNKVAAVVPNDIYITLPKEAADSSVKIEAKLNEVVKAPFDKGIELGEISVLKGGEITSTLSAVSKTEIIEGGFLSNFYIEDATAAKIFKIIKIIFLIILVLFVALMIVRTYNKQKSKKRKAARAKKKAAEEAMRRREWSDKYDQDHDRY